MKRKDIASPFFPAKITKQMLPAPSDAIATPFVDAYENVSKDFDQFYDYISNVMSPRRTQSQVGKENRIVPSSCNVIFSYPTFFREGLTTTATKLSKLHQRIPPE